MYIIILYNIEHACSEMYLYVVGFFVGFGGETITLMVFHIVTLMCPLRAIVPRLVHEVLIVWLANLMSYTLSEYVVPLTEGVVGLVSLPFET